MAKNFKFNVVSDYTKALDNCSYLNTNVRIGSGVCIHLCPHSSNYDYTTNTISCPKIIYRHANGKVIMRKRKRS